MYNPQQFEQISRISRKEKAVKSILQSHTDVLKKDFDLHLNCVLIDQSFQFYLQEGNLDRAEKEIEEFQAFVHKSFFE